MAAASSASKRRWPALPFWLARPLSLVNAFDYAARRFAGRAAFVQGEERIDYAAAAAFSHRVAAGLGRQLARGDKVAVLSPNEAWSFIAVLGILRGGFVWLPINARNALADTIAQVDDFDCDCLLYHSSFEADVARIRASVPRIRLLLCLDRPGQAAPALRDWLADAPATAPPLDLAADEVCMMFGTGGTTGRSKGVMLMHRNVMAMIGNFLAAMPYGEPPVYLAAAPLTHAAGFMCFWIMATGGSTIVLPTANPRAVMQAIEQHRVTTLFLPPTVIYMMLADPEVRHYDYRSLKHFIYGAAPMAADKLKEAVAVFGPCMAQGYGQVEAPCSLTFLPPEEHRLNGDATSERRLTSCGRAMPYSEVAIMDDAGHLLGPEQAGEIVARGDLVMLGYYKNPEATAETAAHGWHHTGDVGLMDADGFVYIVDRKKDMVITGGFNVYPSEVERVLWSHPAVQDCAVIGVPDEKWGEAVKAIIELKPDATASEADLLALCRVRLGGVKAPKSVEFWPQLPRSPVGKVLKRAIRERFWAGRARQI